MAAGLEPGVWNLGNGVNDGTLPRMPSALPGPVCAEPPPLEWMPLPIFAAGPPLRSAIVRVAQNEWRRWNRPLKLRERDPAARKMLQAYWRIGVNWRVADDLLASPLWQNAHPWSAAFVSYVMHMAGAGDQFKYAAAHAEYTRWAIENQVQKRKTGFKGFRLNEATPEPGDLLGKSRSSSAASYDSIQKGGFVPTHCDIVTEVRGKQLVTIGGNVGDSVTETPLTLDKDGHVSQPNYFVVIKPDGPASR